MKAVESKDLESLVRLNSILIFNVGCWGVSYLRNILSHGPEHITAKQSNKTLPTELWLEILNLAEIRINKNTYKLVYGIEITEKSTNGSTIEPTLICNVLEEWKDCGELESGDHVEVYEKCLKDPSYEIDPEKDRVEKDIEPFFKITKTALENAYRIPVSHLRFQGDFLFHNIEVPDIIARLEYGFCNLCINGRSLDIYLYDARDRASFFCGAVLSHGSCGHDAICPLCLGYEYADEYLDVMYGKCADRYSDEEEEEEEEDTEEEKMAKERFKKRLQKRYQDLGYGSWGY
ncbi:cuticle-degrading protease [Fusarium tjaetaba]|uniref:Cuticle-degrading protease n=1 Tax=Fusarium tjaetaba TaxID=1567544 RepID=A0A8H5SAQ8_9HYPO|nr:cuticle-degrading protease [Fusarium tjaetaba]KAF5649494.1 cuticle-degrading protease [Fusarium tjaetaba]